VSRFSEERGAAAITVGLTLVVLFGSGALAVDLGDLWQSRRHLVTATDAAALAAAQSEALGEDGCQGVDDDFVADNYPEASVTDCVVQEAGSSRGTVTVDAKAPVETHFAGILGVNELGVNASTTAAWFEPDGAYSLRPFGLCKDHPAVASWLSSPRGISAPTIVRYSKDSPDACGDAPGNWGIFDFDGGANSTGEIRQWTENGFDGLVRIGDEVLGNTGAFSPTVDGLLAGLVTAKSRFALPIFDAVSGSGSNAEFHIYGFVGVELVSYLVSGPEAGRYIELRFVEMVVAGQCCNTGSGSGIYAVRICDVDHQTGRDNC
jgi:hypothetical protein